MGSRLSYKTALASGGVAFLLTVSLFMGISQIAFKMQRETLLTDLMESMDKLVKLLTGFLQYVDYRQCSNSKHVKNH